MNKIGIYNPYLESRGGGEKVCLALAETLSKDKGNEVSLIAHNKVDLASLEKYFNVDLSDVSLTIINTDNLPLKLALKLPVPYGLKTLLLDYYTLKKLKALGLDIFINNYYQNNLPNVGKHGIYMCMFPQKLGDESGELSFLKSKYKNVLRFLRRHLLTANQEDGVLTYDKVVANSKFTQKFVKKYWGVDSDVLYPICEDMHDSKVKKEKKILNVGRFFAFDQGSHHKRQDFLIDVFSELKDLHESGWELHFAGTIANDKKAKKFVDDLKGDVKGLPVFFHFNASFDELKRLYNESSIYWHATGYGSSPSVNPERQEHFGISTVEAMSASSVPIVINSAGQKEIVQDGINGFLWGTPTELKAQTRQVAAMDPEQLKPIHQQAEVKSESFGRQAFDERVRKILDPYL